VSGEVGEVGDPGTSGARPPGADEMLSPASGESPSESTSGNQLNSRIVWKSPLKCAGFINILAR